MNSFYKLKTLAEEGDEVTFGQVFDKHYKWVYSRAYRMLKDHGDAEEVTQDVFIKVWQKLSKRDTEQGSFQAWLNTVARNTIIDIIRRRKRHPIALFDGLSEDDERPLIEHEDPRPGPERQLEAQESQELIESSLQLITNPNHRIAWILRHLEGYSMPEIARILKRKEGTAKIWVHRCQKELRKILERKGIYYW